MAARSIRSSPGNLSGSPMRRKRITTVVQTLTSEPRAIKDVKIVGHDAGIGDQEKSFIVLIFYFVFLLLSKRLDVLSGSYHRR